MKKLYSLFVLVFALFATACSSDELVEDAESSVGLEREMEVGVSMPENLHSRIAMNDLKLTWEEGDQITFMWYNLNEITVGTVDFTLVSGAGQKNARFAGKVPEGATLAFVAYKTPYLESDTYAIEFDMDYSKQTQKGFNSIAHVKDNLFLVNADNEVLTPEMLEEGLTLQPQNAILRINLKYLPQDFKDLKKISCIVESEYSTRQLGSLAFEGDINDLSNGEDHYLYMVIQRGDLRKGGKLTLNFEGTDTAYDVSVVSTNGKEYVPGYRYDLPVSENEVNTLHNWKKTYYKDRPRNNEIWIKTVGDKVPSEDILVEYSVDISAVLQEEKNELGWYVYRDDSNVAFYTLPNLSRGFKSEIKEIFLPASCQEIPNESFYGAHELTNIILPEDLRIIDKFGFHGCRKLETITIPAGVTAINNYAFNGCVNLKEVNFSKDAKLTTIGVNAFVNTSLKKFVIPRNVSNLGNDYGCSNILESASLDTLVVYAPNTVLTMNPYFPNEYNTTESFCKLFLDVSWKKDAHYEEAQCRWFGQKYASIDFMDAEGNVIK